ncbi:MAG: short-chain dehydrogenase [Planctomycetota bacterium]
MAKPAPERRALVVGGTGMLAGLVESLASAGWSVAVLARGRERLDAVARHPNVAALQADYRDLEAFETAVRTALPVGLVVAWIHSTAPLAPLCLARLVERPDATVEYHHVLGHADGRGYEAPHVEDFAALPGIDYRQVVLGEVRERSGTRWLTHDEIASGVLRAIRSGEATNYVGTTDPWTGRPGLI